MLQPTPPNPQPHYLNDGELAWQDQFSYNELENIGKVWANLPPLQCNGKCQLKDMHTCTICTGCGWDDLGLDH